MDCGARLREARQRQGKSLQQLAATTKISASTLDALEKDDYSRLPSGLFARAFVRSYASELGLDPEPIVDAFVARHPAAAREIPAESGNEPPPPARVVRLLAAAAGALVLGLTGLGAGAYYYWNRPAERVPRADDRVVPPAPPPRPELPAAAPLAPGATPAETGIAPGSSQGPPQPDVAPTAGALVRETDDVVSLNTPLRLAIHPRGRVWVRLVVDGVPQFARELDAGDREERDVRDNAYLEVGNAAAFDFSVNNQPGRALGGEGRVVRTRIDRQTVQALLAR